MKKKVVFFEVEGGSDKGINGHRKDTIPMINALKSKGWESEIIFFRDEWKDEIINYCKDKFDGFVSRVNPGNLENGEKKYFDTLDELSKYGLVGMSTPDEMIKFGAKTALAKLAKTDLLPDDTFAYYDFDSFRKIFPGNLEKGTRILKQNRGSTGSGIYKVEVIEKDSELNNKSNLKITEAVDNHTEIKTLEEFMNFCKKYLSGDNSALVDMKFLPRIKEGELRILLVGEEPIFVVHKKPIENEDSFSATLFSGAKYNYYKPEECKDLVDLFLKNISNIKNILSCEKTPLIWTADFILDFDENGNDKYILGEINCSCVGFTSHLDIGIQEKVADEIIKNIENNY